MVRDFGIQCDEVRARLRSQITQWSTQDSCHDDRCKYEVSIFNYHELKIVTCIKTRKVIKNKESIFEYYYNVIKYVRSWVH